MKTIRGNYENKSLIILVTLSLVGVLVWAKTSNKEEFSLAKNLPQNALIYFQVSDLPEFIKTISDSKVSEKYLESKNYSVFQNKRLGIKLAQEIRRY